MNEDLAPRISLEQWRCLVAVVDAGGYAHAAAALHKSQSSVSYAVQKLEELLDVKAFEIHGRKAVLTPVGEMLYRRAQWLLEEAGGLERAARKASAGWESEISLAVEVLFPTWLILQCLDTFGAESPQTRIELFETVIGGGTEALHEGRVDLALIPHLPPGIDGEVIGTARFIPAAHPDHPLHQLGRELTLRDLRKHRHLVVRDTSTRRNRDAPLFNSEYRWTVSNMSTSIGAACRGYGFAWFPQDKVRSELNDGLLKPLPLSGNHTVSVQMYLAFADRDTVGPGVRRLADIIREQVSSNC